MPKSRTRKGRKLPKIGNSIADRRNISEAFQKKLIEFSGKTLEELRDLEKEQKNGHTKKLGGAYQQAFEFALKMAEAKDKQPKEIGETAPIELDGLSATITPVENIEEEV